MNDIHPKLKNLIQTYNGLVADVEAGNLSYSDALNTLNNMVAIDALGAEWRITESGAFIRALPGESPSYYPPEAFAVLESKVNTKPQYFEEVQMQNTEGVNVKKDSFIQKLKPLITKIKVPRSTFRTLAVIVVAASLVLYIVKSNDKELTPESEKLNQAQKTVINAINSNKDIGMYLIRNDEVSVVRFMTKLIGAKKMGYSIVPGEVYIEKDTSYLDLYIKNKEKVIDVWVVPMVEVKNEWLISGEPRVKM